MLREPTRVENSDRVRRDKQTGRFRLTRLEERIAPRSLNGDDHANSGGHSSGPPKRQG